MNIFFNVTFLFLSVSVFCTSCATIFNGTKQRIAIDSKPQGATVKVHDKTIGITPLSVKLPTRKPLDIVFSYQGYEDKTYFLDHRYEWRWLLLDAPFTYAYICIPFAVDVITQSPYRFVQKKVMMNFDSVYADGVHFDSLQVMKRRAIDLEIMETERQIAALKRQERMIFVEQERNRKIKWREDKIRTQWLLDSTIAEHRRRSYDSSRANNYRSALRFKNVVAIELTSLLVGESRLEYHRNIYKGMSLGIELGYKPAYYAKQTYSNEGYFNRYGPAKEMLAMPFTESYYLGLATKIPIYDLGRGKYYISLVSFLRNSSFHHGVVSWQEGSNYNGANYRDSVSVDQNTYGLKILLGFRKILVFHRIGLEFDTYAGISCRNVTTELFHYEKKKTEYYYNSTPVVITNEAEKIIEFIPTVQLGLKVGVRF